LKIQLYGLICFLLLVICSTIGYFISVEKTYVEVAIINSFLSISMLCCSAVLWKHWYTRILSIALLLLFSFNICLSFGCRFVYEVPFNYGFASSILNTNSAECLSMLSGMYSYLFLFIGIFLLACLGVAEISKMKFSIYLNVFASLWLLGPGVFAIYLKNTSLPLSSLSSLYFSKSHWYHFAVFTESLELNNSKQDLLQVQVDHQVTYMPTEIDNIVLVIGESARRQNMSLYAYPIQTTPMQDQQQERMYIYDNMVSPAGNTILTVPMLLSKVSPKTYEFNSPKFADNIVNLGNHLGLETSWLSTQEKSSRYVSTISNIAAFAQHQMWLTDYDTALIEPFKLALAKSAKKKLIVLHINGSHSNACNNYPKEFRYFKDGNSTDDCYNNSIRYTDSMLGKLFEILRHSNSALLYVSDHGEKRISDRFVHADSQESTRIPFYIWYSPKLQQVQACGKRDETLRSSIILYEEISKLMGARDAKFSGHQQDTIYYLKTDMSVINYTELKP